MTEASDVQILCERGDGGIRVWSRLSGGQPTTTVVMGKDAFCSFMRDLVNADGMEKATITLTSVVK
jgi:hypothetical protein